VKVPGRHLGIRRRQNGVDAEGNLVEGDAAAQPSKRWTTCAWPSRPPAGSLSDIVNVEQSRSLILPLLGPASAPFSRLGRPPDPPALTVQVVAGLANPRFLVEIEPVRGNRSLTRSRVETQVVIRRARRLDASHPIVQRGPALLKYQQWVADRAAC